MHLHRLRVGVWLGASIGTMQKTALASTSFILIYALFYLQHTGGRIAPPAFCLRLGPLKRPHADYTFLVYLLVLAMAIVIGYAFSAAPSCFERNAAACARQGNRSQCFSHCNPQVLWIHNHS